MLILINPEESNRKGNYKLKEIHSKIVYGSILRRFLAELIIGITVTLLFSRELEKNFAKKKYSKSFPGMILN